MGKTYDAIDDDLRARLEAQPVFFVATAPLSEDGHVNVSPKGLDSFRVLGPRRVAYLDLIGSGVETVAHLKENGRITLLFCAFAGAPKLFRLYGRGRAVVPGDEAWSALAARFPAFRSARSIVDVRVTRIADSCGYGVPVMRLERARDQLTKWADRKSDEALANYVRTRNRVSIDGLDGV